MKKNVAIVVTLLVVLFLWACKNPAQNHAPAAAPTGLRYYDSTLAAQGLTLIDKDLWQSFLVDMQGNVVKEFSTGLVDILPDGNMVGRLDSMLVKFDMDEPIKWQTAVSLDIHHSITHDEEGNIYLLSSHVHELLGLKVRFDVVNTFTPDGKLAYEWCVYDHLADFVSVISKSAWVKHLPVSYSQSKSVEDYIKQSPELFIAPTIFHYDTTNFSFEFTRFTSIQVLPENAVSEKNKAFKKGNLLLCFNPYSSYGILNTTTGKIEWAGYLPERTRLHSPTLTPQGTILVFQNSTDSVDWTGNERYAHLCSIFFKKIPRKELSQKPAARLWTSITEYDPITNNKVWEYTANPKEQLQAPNMGSAQRLSNGNTLVCITTKKEGGRVFELSHDKKIVWDYSVASSGSNGNSPGKLFGAKRLKTEMFRK